MEPSRLTISFELSPSAKDLIESKGIPHTAVFKLLVNNHSKTLEYNVTADDEIDIFPLEMAGDENIDPIFTHPSSFIADGHLSKLGRDLRLLGLDTLIAEKYDEKEIIHVSNKAKRMILTRNLSLLQHGSTQYGYWVRNEDPDKQLEEILSRFDLSKSIQPFSRCMSCNGRLVETTLKEVHNDVPPKVREWCDRFHKCNSCGKVYWKGSHYDKLKEKVDRLVEKIES